MNLDGILQLSRRQPTPPLRLTHVEVTSQLLRQPRLGGLPTTTRGWRRRGADPLQARHVTRHRHAATYSAWPPVPAKLSASLHRRPHPVVATAPVATRYRSSWARTPRRPCHEVQIVFVEYTRPAPKVHRHGARNAVATLQAFGLHRGASLTSLQIAADNGTHVPRVT